MGARVVRTAAGLGALLVSAIAQADDARFLIEPEAPDWVIAQPVPVPTALRGERTDLQFLLIDEQVRHDATVQEAYYRVVQRVASKAGAHELTEVRFSFDPSVDHLTIHQLNRVRDDQTIDILRPGDLKIVQQEAELDRQIYNGEVSVIAFLHDVREGDTLDWSWTVASANPAVADRILDTFVFGYSVPVARLHRRLLTPRDQPLNLAHFHDAPDPSIGERDGQREHRWLSTPAPAVALDAETPSWLDPRPHTWVSNFDTWAGVSEWAMPNFQTAPPPSELQGLVASWTRATEDRGERAQRAIDFVQDEIRYLGIEMGPRGLIPHTPTEVLARRFGDCKDKSLLLVTALRAMQIDAWPVLVSTEKGPALPELPPTPYAFNHVIVLLEIDGVRTWIDPTRSLERGALGERHPPDLSWGLVIAAETRDLTRIETSVPPLPRFEVTERYQVSDLYGAVDLAVRTVYRGGEATRMRTTIQRLGADNLQSDWLDHYRREHPGTEVLAAPAITDDPQTGAVEILERYRLPHLWSDDRFWMDAWRVRTELPLPRDGTRSQPLKWRHPEHLVHRVELVLPHAVDLDDEALTTHGPVFEVETDRQIRSETVSLTSTYRTTADHVRPDDLDAHRRAITEARTMLGYWMRPEALAPAPRFWQNPNFWIASILVGIFGGGWMWGVVPALRDRVMHRARARSSAGRTPGEAIRVQDTVSALETLKHVRCACGGRLDPMRRETENVSGSSTAALRLTLPCTQCDQWTERYFRFRD